LAQLLVTFQKCDAPGDDLAKSFVVRPLDPEFGPTAEIPAFDSRFLQGNGVKIVPQQAAHFGPQFKLRPVHLLRLPLHGQPRAAAELWVPAQVKLVGVPLVEAGRKRMAAVLVHKLGQHFKNASLPRLHGGPEQKQKRKRDEKPAHRQPLWTCAG